MNNTTFRKYFCQKNLPPQKKLPSNKNPIKKTIILLEPRHEGFSGNEEADSLAKKGAPNI